MGTDQLKNVAIFGDSILRGVMIDNITKKYVFSKSIDWKGIEKELNIKISNFSKMGSTIKYGYSKLDNYLKNNPDADVIILEFGGNDSDYDWIKVASEKSEKHTSKTSMCDFEKILNDMLDLIIQEDIKPIMMTLPPIHSTRYFDWLTRNGINKESILNFLVDKEVIYRRQELFNAKIVEIANKRSIELVDIRSRFLASDDFLNLICEDGIHPNEIGENLIVQCFIEKFQKTKEEKNEIHTNC